MREMARLLIPHFLKRVRLPRGIRQLLDIGGAHCEYSRALVRRFPGLKATVLDLAGPIATAQRVLEREGNLEGIELRMGNAFEDDLGSDLDAVLLINMVHLFSFDQNRKLLLRIHESLTPHGIVVVMDQFLGVGKLQDTVAGLISLNYFTIGGRCYSVEEMKDLLKDAGFRQIDVKPFLLRAPTVLFQGWKYQSQCHRFVTSIVVEAYSRVGRVNEGGTEWREKLSTQTCYPGYS